MQKERRRLSVVRAQHQCHSLPIGTSIPSGSGGLNPRIYLAHVSGHAGITTERRGLEEVRLSEDEEERGDVRSAG